jgi:hypothetical protein
LKYKDFKILIFYQLGNILSILVISDKKSSKRKPAKVQKSEFSQIFKGTIASTESKFLKNPNTNIFTIS